MFDEQDLKVGERLAALEVRTTSTEATTAKHEEMLQDLKDKLSLLVLEVKQIRNALYLMAGAIAMNVPALSDLLTKIKHLFV